MDAPEAAPESPPASPPALGELELGVLDRLSGIFTSLERPKEVLERLMDLFLGAMRAERGLLLSFDAVGQAKPLVVRNFSPEVVDGMAATWSRRAVDEMAGGGRVVVSDDVLRDRRFKDSQSVVAQNIQSLLCVPIRVAGAVRGAIYVDHRGQSRSFSERDISFARALAELSGVALERAEAMQALAAENSELRTRAARYEFGDVIGASGAMQRVFDRLHKALGAPAEFTILLTGENGTGKTAVAKLIHRQSDRKDRPFVAFGAGSVPDTLVESELFGHRRGSFTGADADRAGLVARAEAGTLFIDDIDALPLPVQPKLLTFLQEREYRPIGGDVRHADLRVICATNADLEARVKDGRFREDLYYRVNGIPIEVPPLRQRQEDIPLLARHFLDRYSKAVDKEIRGFAPDALARMLAYRWPGNVREMMSEVVHAVTMTQGPWIEGKDFKSQELREVRPAGYIDMDDLKLREALNATTYRVLQRALARAEGNISRAARFAGVSRGKLYDLMERVGLSEMPSEARAEKRSKRGRKPAATDGSGTTAK